MYEDKNVHKIPLSYSKTYKTNYKNAYSLKISFWIKQTTKKQYVKKLKK